MVESQVEAPKRRDAFEPKTALGGRGLTQPVERVALRSGHSAAPSTIAATAGWAASAIADDTCRFHQHDGAALGRHHPVVFVPVGVSAPGRGEHGSQEPG